MSFYLKEKEMQLSLMTAGNENYSVEQLHSANKCPPKSQEN